MGICRLIGIDRQVYYRTKKRKDKDKKIAYRVIELVKGLRRKMPRLGTRKLYYKLKPFLIQMNLSLIHI